MFDIDTIALSIFRHIPLLGIDSMETGRSALVHFSFTYTIAVTSIILIKWKKWFWFLPVAWALIVIYQEMIPDGMLRALTGHGWEWTADTPYGIQFRDHVSDFITKFSGFIGLLWGLWIKKWQDTQ